MFADSKNNKAIPSAPSPPSGDYGSILISKGDPVTHGGSSTTAGKSSPAGSTLKSRNKQRHAVLIKTQTSFVEDARHFHEGTVPHSMVLALAIGAVCGVAAYAYYWFLELALEWLWKTLPEQAEQRLWWFQGDSTMPESLRVLWIPLAGFAMATGLGLTVAFLGEPGDLPYTIQCVHDQAYVAVDHVLPMVLASQFSILGGGSLGPEAPLVAICAALGGCVSRTVFRCRERNLIRKHTLMGVRVWMLL